MTSEENVSNGLLNITLHSAKLCRYKSETTRSVFIYVHISRFGISSHGLPNLSHKLKDCLS